MENEIKQAILAVSFGTSYNSSRSITIGAIESTLAESFPEFTVRRAFTSGMIISKLENRDRVKIDNVSQALKKLKADGFTDIYIQPTHIIEGDEYDLITQIAEEFRDSFNVLKLGHSLLTCEKDLKELASLLDNITADHSGNDTARVFMGHGTEHKANEIYAALQQTIDAEGITNMHIATVEDEPSIEDIAEKLKTSGIKNVLLSPLMIVAGDHAVNDMAGDCEDSWKSILEMEGFNVECRVAGLGSIYEVQQMIVSHCRKLIGTVI